MAGLEDKVDRLANALERMLDQGRFSGGGGTGGGGGGAANNGINSFNSGLNQTITSVSNLARGNSNLTTVIGDVTKVFGAFGPVGDLLGKTFGNISNELIQMNQSMMASSRYGMGFSQNLGLFTEQLAKAGIGQQQWVNLLQNNAKYLQGSASSAEQAANLFLTQSQALMKEGTVIQARLAGIDLSEFQDELIISTNMLKFNSIQSERTQKVLQDSVIQTTIEIDNMSRITGKSRQEIQKGIDNTMKSNTMQLAMMAMSAEELARYKVQAASINQYGEPVAKLFAEMSANRGNIVNKETGATAAALETIAPQAARALRELSTETDAERRKQLQIEFEFRMAEAAADKDRMKQFVALAERGEPGVKEIVQTLIQGQAIIGANLNALEAGGGTRAGFEAQRAEILRKAGLERRPGEEGATPGNQVSVAINAAEAGVKTIAAGLATGVNDLNTAAGKQLLELQLSNTYLQAFNTKAVTPEHISNLVKDAIGYSGRPTTPGSPGEPSAETKREFNIRNDANTPIHVQGTVRIDPTSPVTRQAFGSKDTFGDWFNGPSNLLSFMNEQGPEAVVPKGKIGEFINDMIAQSPGMLSGLQGSLRNSMAENNPTIAIQKAFEQFSSSINIPSTVSPSGSSSAINGSIVETKTTSDLHDAIEKLNSKMDKLITAVEDGANANVKAVKSRGNLIA